VVLIACREQFQFGKLDVKCLSLTYYTRTHTHARIHTRIHTHTHTHTHTHARAHTHTHPSSHEDECAFTYYALNTCILIANVMLLWIMVTPLLALFLFDTGMRMAMMMTTCWGHT